MVSACQKSTEGITSTVVTKPVIEVTSTLFSYDINNYLIQTVNTDGGTDITNSANFSITEYHKLFTSTPLQSEFLKNIKTVNDLVIDFQTLGNETLENVIFYEDLSYDFNKMGNITVIESEIEITDSIINANLIKVQLSSDHHLLDQYNLNNNVIVEFKSNEESFSINVYEQAENKLFSFTLNLLTNEIDIINKLNGNMTLTLDNLEDDYQLIKLDNTTNEINQSMYFYGNTTYGAIYNDYMKGNDSINDFEVYRYKVGLLYKSMTSTINNVSESINGYTLNSIKNWKSFSVVDSLMELHLENDLYDIELNNDYLEVNDFKFVNISDGISVINLNNHLYSNEPYYAVGYFMQMNSQIDNLYSLDISELAGSELSFNNIQKSNINSLTKEIQEIVNYQSTEKLELRKVISENHDTNTNTFVSLIDQNDSVEVLILNNNHELVNSYDYQEEVSYQDGLLFVYEYKTGLPVIKIKKVDHENKLIDVKEYSFSFLAGKIINSVNYDQVNNRLNVLFSEGDSNYCNKMIVNLTTHEQQIVFKNVEDTFIEETTDTLVEVVTNEEDILLLLIYNNLGELMQVTTGVTEGSFNVVLNNYKIQDNVLMLYGQNNEKPYLFIPKFTEDFVIDNNNTIAYTHYLKGSITEVSYLSDKYSIDMQLEDQSAYTIELNLDGEEVGALIKLGYVTDWSNWNPDDEKFAKLTHINYSFAHLGDQEGTVVESFSKAYNIARLKQNNPHLKIILSIGGWGANYFSEAAETDEHRKQFAKTSIEIIKKYGMNGIDLDWEYPTSTAGGIITASPDDKYNFTLLLKQIREDLNVLEQATGDEYILSIAAGAFMSNGENTQLTEIIKYLDFINVMTYDMEKWVTGGRNTSHHANLYTSNKVPGQVGATTYIERFINNGVPASKLLLGTAFYGRGASGINVSPDNVFDKFFTGANSLTYTYTKIKNELLIPSSGYTRYWDDTAKSPYVFNGDKFISYDDPQSIEAKVNYVKDNNLRGIFFWEFTQDQTGDLINAIDQYSR
jgi:chitinase